MCDEPQEPDLQAAMVVNTMIPEEQEVVTVDPETPVSEALEIMREGDFSQLPVVRGDTLLGLFSYRSFSHEVARRSGQGADWGRMEVIDFLESPEFVHLDDEIHSVLSKLNRWDAVLVRPRDRLRGILTTMDVLRHLHELTRPFLQVAEIELMLRELIRSGAAPDDIPVAIESALAKKYGSGDCPETLQDLSFSDHVLLLEHGSNEQFFGGVIGRRESFRTTLRPVIGIRNQLFHFRGSLDELDRQNLERARSWLSVRCQLIV